MSDSHNSSAIKRPVILCVLDGWGVRADSANNAIAQAATPNWDRYVREMPMALLKSCALHVGLPDGQMGNSEVGHTNLGAGRIVMQDLPRIDAAVADGSLAAHPILNRHVEKLRETGGTCHVLGLLSPGGVHSHQDHMVELASAVSNSGVSVRVHAFLDGRDTPPKAGGGLMNRFLDDISALKDVCVATISGRYYAMDRDNRWDRVSQAYNVMVGADGARAPDPMSAIGASYDEGLSDEFMRPTVIDDYVGMADGDGLLMANFRADRAREILAALVDPAFDGFKRDKVQAFAARTGMVEYSRDLNGFFDVLFAPLALKNILGEVVANAGLTQLRIAETEKYAHVTFFLNGGREAEFEGEDRILVPSPKVATYDLQPEMSAPEVTDELVSAISAGTYDLIVANYANGDMVGHTGVLDAAKIAVETVDKSLGRLEEAVVSAGGVMLITADHGNCEEMIDTATGDPHTQHTLNDVPILMLNGPKSVTTLKDGSLSDVAPTILKLLNLVKPNEMTGISLIPSDRAEEELPREVAQ